jgi:hypothetical protein
MLSDNNCDLTRVLIAHGGGTDVLSYDWEVTQESATITINTSEPRITITQVESTEPVGISVASWCLVDEDPALTTPTPTVFIDFSSSSSSPLGQPGQIEIMAVNGGVGGFSNGTITSNVGLFTTFFWTNSNEASGHIQHTPTIHPSSLGHIVQTIGDNGVLVEWDQAGSGGFRVTALNTCSSLTGYMQISVQISN